MSMTCQDYRDAPIFPSYQQKLNVGDIFKIEEGAFYRRWKMLLLLNLFPIKITMELIVNKTIFPSKDFNPKKIILDYKNKS